MFKLSVHAMLKLSVHAMAALSVHASSALRACPVSTHRYEVSTPCARHVSTQSMPCTHQSSHSAPA
eukprot:1883850-Rhodomonas_salina.1